MASSFKYLVVCSFAAANFTPPPVFFSFIAKNGKTEMSQFVTSLFAAVKGNDQKRLEIAVPSLFFKKWLGLRSQAFFLVHLDFLMNHRNVKHVKLPFPIKVKNCGGKWPRTRIISTTLLLNEVFEESREIWNEVSEIFSEICSKFAPKLTPKCFVLSWQVEKSSPKISPDFSHRKCQISNRNPNQISPKISQTHFCSLGSPNKSFLKSIWSCFGLCFVFGLFLSGIFVW